MKRTLARVLDFPDELRERLLLEPEPFDELLAAWLGAVAARECGPEQIQWGLAYPWERPPQSYLLRDGEVLPPDERYARDRHPILAFGSNVAPETLARKFAHFTEPSDREVLVLAGELHDFDVAAAATVAIYGAMPATLFSSPGARVRAAVLYTTDAQATQLTWSELSYRFGRLDDIHLAVDDSGEPITCVLVYVNRFGAFAPDGEPVALAAVPARERRAPALTQRELLDRVAELIGLAGADDVVRAVHDCPGDLFHRVRAHVRPRALAFDSDRWTPYS